MLHLIKLNNTLGRIPLDEGSARRIDLSLITQNIYIKQAAMHPAGYLICNITKQQTYNFDRTARRNRLYLDVTEDFEYMSIKEVCPSGSGRRIWYSILFIKRMT